MLCATNSGLFFINANKYVQMDNIVPILHQRHLAVSFYFQVIKKMCKAIFHICQCRPERVITPNQQWYNYDRVSQQNMMLENKKTEPFLWGLGVGLKDPKRIWFDLILTFF